MIKGTRDWKNLGVMLVFLPFDWRLGFDYPLASCSIRLNLGPFAFAVGWP